MRGQSVTHREDNDVGSREVSGTLEGIAVTVLAGTDLVMGVLALLGAPVSGWQVGFWLVLSGLYLGWYRVARR